MADNIREEGEYLCLEDNYRIELFRGRFYYFLNFVEKGKISLGSYLFFFLDRLCE